MTTKSEITKSKYDCEFVRIIDAPKELVYKAWTEPKHVAQWWGPTGFTNPVCELDVRTGGAIRIHMCAPDGVIYPMAGVYKEIIPSKKIAFSSSALDDASNPIFENLNTIVFEEQNGKTQLKLSTCVIKTTAGADQYLRGMKEGWMLTLDRLEEHLRD